MTGVAQGWEQGSGLPAPGADEGAESAPALSGAALAYQELGWPVTLRGEQVSLNLDLDVDAVAVVIPVGLAARVVEILVGRRCPPPVLAHPALATHRVIVAGERFGVPLGWPVGTHRVTGTLLLPPTVTGHGPVRWVRPPQPHALRWCREVDVCAALATALCERPQEMPADEPYNKDGGSVEQERLRPLTKGRRITGRERDTIATRLRDRYALGASIRELMSETGRSYGWTHRLLRESGVELRGRGGAHPRTVRQAGVHRPS